MFYNWDECVSPTGCSYTTVDCDDYDACTDDSCDSETIIAVVLY